ncbi:MAG TPA: branched-chain amino acid ABC transporter ATP-binding protein/permease [Bacillales bacterium]|nr:branched-chain amino acid ABC transporter ATP-binding protein/permease [Bacillales bacterium]
MLETSKINSSHPLRSMRKSNPWSMPVLVIIALAAVVLPVIFGGNTYFITLMIKLVSYGIATLGITVALGYAGQIALSQAAFFGLGAYAFSVLAGMHGVAYWPSFIVGILVPVLAGLILGAICLRLVTHYLALTTIGFGFIIELVLQNWNSVTGGPDGVQNIPRPTIPFIKDLMISGAFGLRGDVWFYWFGLLMLAIACFIVFKLRNSRLGRALLAIREDELTAQTNGINVFTAKILAFSLSAGLGGLGGIVFASGYMYISPTQFSYNQSVIFFGMTIIGGSFSIIGTLIGTLFLGILPDLLRSFNQYYNMIFGGLIILTMIFFPRGIWGIATRISGMLRKNKAQSNEKAPIKFRTGNLSFLGRKLKKGSKDSDISANQSNIGNILLDVKGLKKYFGGVKAVDGLDFQVKRGEIHALIGPNGSGKTTVINVLSGIYTATDGMVAFKDNPITNQKPHRIVKQGVSRTFQNIRLFPDLSVIENVMIGNHSRTSANLASVVLNTKRSKSEEREIRRKAEEALEFVGFTKYEEKARNLSYGQRRMVEIARTLIQEPELLLLDEPAAGMNPEETKELVKLLKRLNELGLTLFLIEHDMDLITDVADYVSVLDFGKKISDGKVEEVLKDPEVIKAYLGEEFVSAANAE